MGQLNYTTAKTNELLEKIESFPESVSDGKTPVFVIGTVSTLDPGMSATASVTQDGVDEQGNPKYKLNLGIPKGLDGAGGGGGGVAVSVQWANVLNKPSWIGSTKPTYTASEVGALPSTTIIPSKVSQLTNDSGYLTSSGFKTINGQSIVGSGNISITSGGGTIVTSTAWADITGKPTWIGSSKPTYTASEVGALPASTTIPSKTSQLFNDSGYTTSTSFKTINGESIVGSGNIVIKSSAGGGTPSGEGGNVKVTNASSLRKVNYYAFKPSEDGSVEGTFSLIPNATESKEGLMSSFNYEKLGNIKSVIALPVEVADYDENTSSDTIEAMLSLLLGEGIAPMQFILIASALGGEYNADNYKFYIGEYECLLSGSVDSDSVSATLEFSYVSQGKLRTISIALAVSGSTPNFTYTYSAKKVESGDDTYYLPIAVDNLNPGSTHEDILAAFGGSIDEVVAALKGGKRITLAYSLVGIAHKRFPVSASEIGSSVVTLSYYDTFTSRLREIICNTLDTSQSEFKEIYTSGYPLKPEILSLSSSSTSDEISIAVGGESGLKAIIRAVKNGNRLFFKGTGENDLVSLAYPYSVIYSVSDNGDMSFAFGYWMYAILGFSNIGLAINYTKSSNTFTCNKTTA